MRKRSFIPLLLLPAALLTGCFTLSSRPEEPEKPGDDPNALRVEQENERVRQETQPLANAAPSIAKKAENRQPDATYEGWAIHHIDDYTYGKSKREHDVANPSFFLCSKLETGPGSLKLVGPAIYYWSKKEWDLRVPSNASIIIEGNKFRTEDDSSSSRKLLLLPAPN